MGSLCFEDLDIFPDPKTETFLQPGHLIQCDNRDEIELYKIALRKAMEKHLTERQRYVLNGFYWEQKSKTQIGRELGLTPSAVCKVLKTAHEALRKQIIYCFEVYTLLRKVLRDDFP